MADADRDAYETVRKAEEVFGVPKAVVEDIIEGLKKIDAGEVHMVEISPGGALVAPETLEESPEAFEVWLTETRE